MTPLLLLPEKSSYDSMRLASERTEQMAIQSRKLIDEAAKLYKLDGIYALFSGGHDSLTATHIVSKHPLFHGVIHIDTGTGLPATRKFVEEVCSAQGWELIVKSPSITYEQLIIRWGFPGAPQHKHMYRYLKERPLTQAKIVAAARTRGVTGKAKVRIAFTGGMRAQESIRRMGHVESMHKDGMGVWVSVIHNWTALDCNEYMRVHALPRSLVKDTIHLSGECFCGSFARPNEKRELAFWYPDHAAKIEAWQRLVKTAVDLGLSKIPFNHQQWGHWDGIPDEQMELMPMCWFCRGDTFQEAS